MIDKERTLAMRLEVLGVTLDGMDFKDEPIEQGVWEGLVFNIGKLLLDHLEEHHSSPTTTNTAKGESDVREDSGVPHTPFTSPAKDVRGSASTVIEDERKSTP